MVNNVESGLPRTFSLVTELNTALEPLDLEALENLPTRFTTLLGRIDNVDTGLNSKASITALNTKANQSDLIATNDQVALRTLQSTTEAL